MLRLTNFVVVGKRTTPDSVKSIKLGGGKRTPPKRHLALYGNTEAMQVLQAERIAAMKEGKAIVRVTIDVDVGKSQSARTSLDSLKEAMFLNLGRTVLDLDKIILDILDAPSSLPRDPVAILQEHPSWVNKIWDDRRFRHLKVICWTTDLSNGILAPVAAIRSPRVVSDVINRNTTAPLKLVF